MRSRAGHGVKCRGCAGVYHDTTDKFDFTQRANGTMFRLREPWAGWGWQDFPKDSSVMYESVACPSCGVSYCDGAGYVKLDIDFRVEELEPIKPKTPWELEAEAFEGYEPDTPNKQYDQMEDDGKVPCPFCGDRFKPGGLHFHIKAKHASE